MAVFTYPEVTISATDFTVYADLDTANTYMLARIGNAKWTSATEDVRRAALATATRMLDNLEWAGEKTDAANAHAHPRSGLTDREGEELDEDELAPDIVSACIELAFSLVKKPGSADQADATGSNIDSIQAGPVAISFASQVKGSRFPTRVDELVAPYISAAGAAGAASQVFGQDCDGSQFNDCDRAEWDKPLS